jgi:transcriptional regulator of acetoin/glycerol metabolism
MPQRERGSRASCSIAGTRPPAAGRTRAAAAGRAAPDLRRARRRRERSRAIHSHDPNPTRLREGRCSGPTPEEIELQLFGVLNKRGAAATPKRRSLERIGADCRLRDSDSGILFLENVMDLPARAQARLVRVLRDREVFIGDDAEPVPLDIRAIGRGRLGGGWAASTRPVRTPVAHSR